MAYELDDINKEIIKYLKDGRESLKTIAQKVPVSENTVKSRIEKLQKTGVLDITAVVDPTALKGHQLIYIGMQVLNLKLVDKATEISKLRGVVSASVVTGRYDLLIVVHLTPEFGLLEFLSDELSKVNDIALTETFVVYKAINLKIPPAFSNN